MRLFRRSRCCVHRLAPVRTFTTPNPLPATFMRGGTSKGVFLNRKYLPTDPAEWEPIFRGIMGSPDPYGRQLNGMGGGLSSLSKICVVGPPQSVSEPVDLEYTFIQLGVVDGSLDLSGNCGNLTTAVGIFALDEKICRIPSLELYPNSDSPNRRKAIIKLRNTNTAKTIRTSFPVSPHSGLATLMEAEIAIAGVPGRGSRVLLEFLNPAGAKTGRLLPTGRIRDSITVAARDAPITVTCIDATNPTVFVAASSIFVSSLSAFYRPVWPDHVFPLMEEVRKKAAVLMGLDPAVQAQPKICMVTPGVGEGCELAARALSMGVLHKAIPSTVALCLGAAAGVRGSVVEEVMGGDCWADGEGGLRDVRVKVEIPGGVVDVQAKFEGEVVRSVAIERTARRLMRGEVFW